MKIKKVRFNNFRQFYGKQELEFTCDSTKNVTLIHAENGFGKTTILNAVLWALYYQTTKKFEKPEDIVNYEAVKEGQKTASVDVEFEFNAENYIVTRNFDNNIERRDKAKLIASKIVRGNHQPLLAPETFVNSVIPSEMAKYFFFDGEAAEAFSSATNFKEIGLAIRSILGCELADTAISDLRDTAKQIDKELGGIEGENELKEIEDQISKNEQELETALSLKLQIEEKIATFTTQRNEIDEKLRILEGSKHIQISRDEKQEQLKQKEDDLKKTKQEIIKWIGQRAVQVISRRIAQATLDFIDEASLKGRIPSPYNEDFVNGLLAAEECICHRPIKAGTPEWKAVAELLKNASNAETMGRVVRARARVSQLREESNEAPNMLIEAQNKYAALLESRTKLEQELGELSKKIADMPVKEIAERERSRRHLDEKISKENQNLGGVRNKIYEYETKKRQLVQDLERVSRKSKQAQKLLIRRQLLVQSSEVLKTLLEDYEEKTRKTIEGEINGILQIVAHRDYTCHLKPNFSMELRLSNERPIGKSSGENQLLSLVFIGSLVKFAAARINDRSLILKPGTVAPLLLDAPLGQLDTNYQEDTARYIPKLAEQVVLLLSSGQGGERVLNALEPYIGAEYILISENKSTRKEKPEHHRILHGKDYTISVFNQPRNMTRIERIR